MSVENLHNDCTSVVGAVVMEPSYVSGAIKDASSPPESLKQPMAFMLIIKLMLCQNFKRISANTL
jgi:hypothetical protein